MIPKAFINEWRRLAPWLLESQVEQDLVLSRAIVEIFSDPLLADSLAFRGGTALHKLFIQPDARYSEDIDLVQTTSNPIGPVLDALRNRLNPWLGEPKWKLKEGRAILVYRFESEGDPVVSMRLKVEINTREHFTVLGLIKKKFALESSWFNQRAELTTYTLEELLGTKLRALYQRKKGRDLFDLSASLKQFPNLEIGKIVKSFNYYMQKTALLVAIEDFENNLIEKMGDKAFLEDVSPLLSRDTLSAYDPLESAQVALEEIIQQF